MPFPDAIVLVIIKNANRNCKLENGSAIHRPLAAPAGLPAPEFSLLRACVCCVHVVYGPFIDFYGSRERGN